VLFLLAFVARPAAAQSCTISATSVAFGTYTGPLINVTGTLTAKCTGNANYDIGLNAGTASGATVTNRSMTGPASALMGYGLYSDAGYSVNWGNSSSTGWVSKSGPGSSSTNYTVYAQLPVGEYAAVGSYSDTITATVFVGGVSFATTTFSVTVTVAANCAISANNLAFGTYAGSLISSTSIITATCTSGTTYNVGLNAGTATGATVTNRSMAGPASALLSYKLFSNSGYTANWGNTVGTDTVAGTGTGSAQSLTVYGQVPAGQLSTPGSYTDTITATITY